MLSSFPTANSVGARAHGDEGRARESVFYIMALTIHWRGSIPNQPLRGHCEGAVVAAATPQWQTGPAAGLTFVEVTIRGPDHSTTRQGGRVVHIGRHITANYKTTAMQGINHHIAAHIFLNGTRPNVWTINHIDWFGPNPDFAEEEDEEAT
ncbi:hypothetical protein LshimejAT787_0606340 [Lyophyllum shimeji]|uniref:Uncharacterized protein n=1 Tax=Lyophyllum shimeji TaxID=47721 RepID=A0A9P3PN67_LYOSH|nr:hypothetical protein LshimejAT787_0606340 [Lyophyllum shimeji]